MSEAFQIDAVQAGAFQTGLFTQSFEASLKPIGSRYATLFAELPGALLGWWRLGDVPGNAADSSGNGRTLTQTGTVVRGLAGLITGDPDAASGFNGSANYFKRADAALRPTSGVTLLVWIQTSDTKATMYVAGCGDTGNNGYAMWLAAGALQVKIGSGAAVTSILTSSQIANGARHLIALTHDGVTLRAYVDGLPAAGTNSASAAFSIGYGAITDFGIGTLHNLNAARYLNGTGDDVGLHNRALTPAEMLAVWNGGAYSAGILRGKVLDAGLVLTGAMARQSYRSHGASLTPSGDSDFPSVFAAISTWFGWWRFGEEGGNALDQSGNARTLTQTGTVDRGIAGLIVGDPNTAAAFDGAANYFKRVDAALRPTAGVTLLAFIKTSDTKTTMYVAGAGDTGVNGYTLWLSAGFLVVKVGSGAATVAIGTSHQVADGVRHLVALVHDGVTLKAYVDGLPATGSNSASAAFAIGYGNITEFGIGALHNLSALRYFNGVGDEFAVGVPLSDAQILAIWNASNAGVVTARLYRSVLRQVAAGLALTATSSRSPLIAWAASLTPGGAAVYRHINSRGRVGTTVREVGRVAATVSGQ